jgi:hypothetical protein
MIQGIGFSRMVKFSYQARQQARGLTFSQKAKLNRVLMERAQAEARKKTVASGKFVEKLDDHTRVMWKQGEDGNPLVLTIVSQQSSEEPLPY